MIRTAEELPKKLNSILKLVENDLAKTLDPASASSIVGKFQTAPSQGGRGCHWRRRGRPNSRSHGWGCVVTSTRASRPGRTLPNLTRHSDSPAHKTTRCKPWLIPHMTRSAKPWSKHCRTSRSALVAAGDSIPKRPFMRPYRPPLSPAYWSVLQNISHRNASKVPEDDYRVSRDSGQRFKEFVNFSKQQPQIRFVCSFLGPRGGVFWIP